MHCDDFICFYFTMAQRTSTASKYIFSLGIWHTWFKIMLKYFPALRATDISKSVGGRIHSTDCLRLQNGGKMWGYGYFFIHKPWNKPQLEYPVACRKCNEVCGMKSELWYLVWSRCSYAVLPPSLSCIATTRSHWFDNTVLHNAFTVVWTRFGHLRARVELRQLYI